MTALQIEIDSPSRKVCCCGVNVWSWWIASICFFHSIFSIVLSIREILREESLHYLDDEDFDDIPLQIKLMSMEYTPLVCAVGRLLVDIIFLIGLHLRKPWCIKLWLIEFSVELVVILILIFVANRSMDWGLSSLIFEFASNIAVHCFFLWIVAMHRLDILHLKNKKQREDTIILFHQSV